MKTILFSNGIYVCADTDYDYSLHIDCDTNEETIRQQLYNNPNVIYAVGVPAKKKKRLYI